MTSGGPNLGCLRWDVRLRADLGCLRAELGHPRTKLGHLRMFKDRVAKCEGRIGVYEGWGTTDGGVEISTSWAKLGHLRILVFISNRY